MMANDLNTSNLSAVFFERFFSDWRGLKTGEFLDFLAPKIDQIITREELEKRLSSGKILSIKFGIDPTGPDVHLGHLLPIFVLNQFKKAGHKINLIIGDFTATIGDPSGRNDQRPFLTEKGVENNAKTYFGQIEKYLDLGRVKKLHNSKWLKKVSFAQMLSDLRQVNVSEVLQREDFRARIKAGHSLTMAELLYSYAQGVDSVEVAPDVEVGGRDQLLNFAFARALMSIRGQVPQIALTTPVLEGISGDGRKMSKSYGNYIAVSATLEDKFGKLMSIPDSLIEMYFKAFADVKESELETLRKLIKENPLETKKQLAQFFVAIEAKSLDAGKNERTNFENKFSKGVYEHIPVHVIASGTINTITALKQTGKFESNSELHRLFNQGGVWLVEPEEKELKENDPIPDGIVRAGKTKFFKFVIKK